MLQKGFSLFFLLILAGCTFILVSSLASSWRRASGIVLREPVRDAQRTYRTSIGRWVEAGAPEFGEGAPPPLDDFLSRQRGFDFGA